VALELGLDLGAILLLLVAVGILTLMVWIAEQAKNANPFGGVPYIGDAWNSVWNHVVGWFAAAQTDVIRWTGNVWHSLVNNIALLGGLAVLLVALIVHAVQTALQVLWNHSIPALIVHYLKAVTADAARALTVARTAGQDAQQALDQAAHIVSTTIPSAIHAAEVDAAHLADAAYTGAVQYASPAVTAVAAVPVAAANEIGSLLTTAVADPEKAFEDALSLATAIAVPVGGDITQIEDYIKSLGLAGLVAAVTGLSYVMVHTLAEAGLTQAECRNKVGGICGVNPNAWSQLLGLAGFLAIGFDFKAFVDAASTVSEFIGTAAGELEAPFLGAAPPLAVTV
jgi:hypothetical protein